ncbi:MAG TPA: energy-coupling factor transporter transmembrane protein EcfT [Firmicutes bacterium]|jgi:energy-coupling factor transport system permease protein|nr:energy-coupling factor transporter transmembrane protein EcfT [Bacillota bacterium]HOQ23932.1 energy-coupling factor transporter transmembrane component T [Bacillota bacterium]HPT67185.1 energy-coupling factor transporter transmembrane component T [Bacillota bacterium]
MAGLELTGRYWPGCSFWHDRDPRTKLGLVTGYLLLIIGLAEGKAQIVLAGLLLCLYISAKIPLRRALGNLIAFRWLIILTFLANLFFVRGATPLGSLAFVTREGLAAAALYTLRLINLLLCSFWLTMTVRPLALISALEKLLQPFRSWLPVGEFALAMGLAVRFLPLLLEEGEEIRLAQQARGAGRRSALQNLVTLAVPLFVGVVRRSGELADAMEIRGYVPGASRTDWAGSTWNRRETLTLLAGWSVLLLLAFVLKNL